MKQLWQEWDQFEKELQARRDWYNREKQQFEDQLRKMQDENDRFWKEIQERDKREREMEQWIWDLESKNRMQDEQLKQMKAANDNL